MVITSHPITAIAFKQSRFINMHNILTKSRVKVFITNQLIRMLEVNPPKTQILPSQPFSAHQTDHYYRQWPYCPNTSTGNKLGFTWCHPPQRQLTVKSIHPNQKSLICLAKSVTHQQLLRFKSTALTLLELLPSTHLRMMTSADRCKSAWIGRDWNWT